MSNKKFFVLNFFLTIIIISLGGIFLSNMIDKKLENITGTIQNFTIQAKNNQKKSVLGVFENQIIDTIDEASKSVVSIIISKNMKFYMEDPSNIIGPGSIQNYVAKIGGGSGIIISKDGYILTNKHVVEDINAKYSVVLYDGTNYQVDKIWFDENIDIAVLKIVDDKGNSPVNLSEANFISILDEVKIGQFAFAIGNSLSEYKNSVTMGIISARNREIKINQGKNLYIGLYQTDAPINPGNSGGPLLDIYGNVIGITTAMNDMAQGVAFAIPLTREFINATLQSIKEYNKIIRPLIGISYVDIDKNIQKKLNLTVEHGIYIKDVFSDLPAFVAGIKEGDIVIAIDDKPINQKTPFLYQLYTYTPNTQITLTVIRKQTSLKIPLVLGQNAN